MPLAIASCLREIFELVGIDGSGSLNFQELEVLLAALDRDGDNCISVEEFLQLLEADAVTSCRWQI